MRMSKSRLTRFLFAFACLVLFTTGQELFAQEEAFNVGRNLDRGTEIERAGVNRPEDVKTLEQVRSLGGLETGLRPAISNADGTISAGQSLSPRDLAMARIRDLKRRLSLPNADQAELVPQLKTALAEYFIADMQHRVHELDEIKAKVAETEANLQKRLDSQQGAVDLQLKIMIREADGFGFFHKEGGDAERLANPSPGTSGPMTGYPYYSSSAFGLPGPPHIPLGAPAGLTKPLPPIEKE